MNPHTITRTGFANSFRQRSELSSFGVGVKLLDGRETAQKILENLKKEIKKNRLHLKLAIILLGENPISKVFIKQKQKACKKIGIDFELFKFPSGISISELKEEIKKISQNPTISGIVIQLPLPQKMREKDQEILNLVPPDKDIDILSEKNLGKFYSGTLLVFPPVVGATAYLLKKYKISIKGKNVVLIGTGQLVGFPLALWLFREKATVSVVNEFTPDISSFTKQADIIISGVGKPNLITGKMVKRGAIVVDVGFSLKNGKIVGDVDFKSVFKKASYITPVPGGVGPMTVACLLENLVKLARY